MSKYLERINLSKEAKSEAASKRAAAEAGQQLEVDIFATKRSISETEGKQEEAKGQVPLNAGNIISLGRTLEALNADLEALEALKKELF